MNCYFFREALIIHQFWNLSRRSTLIYVAFKLPFLYTVSEKTAPTLICYNFAYIDWFLARDAMLARYVL